MITIHPELRRALPAAATPREVLAGRDVAAAHRTVPDRGGFR